jgi:hypothetical protein
MLAATGRKSKPMKELGALASIRIRTKYQVVSQEDEQPIVSGEMPHGLVRRDEAQQSLAQIKHQLPRSWLRGNTREVCVRE